MKKIVSLLTALLVLFGCFSLVGCAGEEEEGSKVVRIYNWEEYIDPELIPEFEEEFGYTVEYATFGTNENMYNDLKINNSVYDVIIPSEYMIIKMAREGLLYEFDDPREQLDVYYENASPYIYDDIFTNKIVWTTADGKTHHLSDYATCYMWGTIGLTYSEEVDEEDMTTWTSLWEDTYFNKFSMKDSVRDSIIVGIAYAFRDELTELAEQYDEGELTITEYNDQVQAIFDRVPDKENPEYLQLVKDAMVEMKDGVYSFEVDAGKQDIVTGKTEIYLAWSGDAVYAMIEADEEDRPLYYSIPKEGSNIWFDGMVIPKNHQNLQGALDFINFMSRPSSAVRNMEYIGYTSSIVGDEVFEIDYYDEDEETIIETVEYTGVKDWIIQTYGLEEEETEDYFAHDLSYLFGEEVILYTEEYGRQFTTQYPDESSIARCTVMKYLDNTELELINDAWEEIKGVTLSWWLIAVIVAAIIAVIALFVILTKKKFTVSNLFIKKDRKGKVISVENLD